MNEVVTSRLAVLRSRVDYQGFVLGFICAIVTLLLMIGQDATREPIEARLAEDRAEILAQVLPAEYYDNDPLHTSVLLPDSQFSAKPVEVFIATRNGQVSATVFQIETEGYGGTITLMVSLDRNGSILGLRVLSHKETPGLADKIETDKSDWITHFNGESLTGTPMKDWAVKKDGGKFDQFTGATITPRAVVRGVVSGLQFYARNADSLLNSTATMAQKAGDKS